MAIAPNTSSANMNSNNQDNNVSNKAVELVEDDEHELYDMVMPGFRFHPTEEELVEFYLRRKVEGKRFNVELITFLDLYRYDPWELPGLAAIGEKEWYFYVPRDRKYRNGDRPNRVTTSGYWKATGADRMIRSENFRSIGLKKTLVFYSGKAPKGIRTSWIMNEYRLPLHETERLQKVEISLCRVYKRAGVDDHPSLPRSLLTTNKASSSKGLQSNYGKSQNQINPKNIINETSPSSSTNISSSNHNSSYTFNPLIPMVSTIDQPPNSLGNDQTMVLLQSRQATNPSFHDATINDDLHKLVNINSNNNNYLSANINDNNNLDQNPDLYLNNVPNLLSHFSTLQPAQHHTVALNVRPGSFQAAGPVSDRLWDWNGINSEASKDFTNLFK